MKMNVIALAVTAALAAPLAAQAEVKVSGQLQAELVSWSGDSVNGMTINDAQEAGVQDSGNFGALNFTASEDLGNGMKAIAKVGFKTNASTGAIGERDTYVGLSGNFGTVMAGKMSTPYKMATVKWDPFLATSGQARGNYGASALHNGYAANAVAYANKFGMAKVAIAMAFDESTTGGDYDNENTISASLNMPVGPVELGVGYHSVGTANSDTGATATKVGVKYAAGAIGAAFTYEALEAGVTAAATVDQTIMLLSGTYTMGANTFALNYGTTDNDGGTAPVNMTVGMVHGFSKKTSAHVAYTSLDNDAGTTDSGIAVGLRVKF